MHHSDRRTKIVCTIGPATNTRERIMDLAKAGMNVVRLNFSHGTHDDHKKVIEHIRSVAQEIGYSIPILMDLQGPKIRVGHMLDGVQTVTAGDYVTLTPDLDVIGTSTIIPIDYPTLAKDAVPGDTILLDDGLFEFRVVKKDGGAVTAQVINGGLLKSRKGVNLPGVKLSIPATSEKDIEDLEFGLSMGVDLVALSFVRNAEDVQNLISRIRSGGSNAGIIAKIEKPEAINNFEEILEETDGIMVARGDLGIEIPSETVPLYQKRMIRACRAAGKPVITATQMLESMITNPRATRAESSDVANAVLDGTDAIMLSGETAAGKYPIEAVKVMDKICRSIERQSTSIYMNLDFNKPEWKEKQVIESLSYSCVRMAEEVDAKVIATITHSGTTARRIAKYRPRVPVIAFTESLDVRRQLNLVWGVQSVKMKELFETDRSVQLMEEYLLQQGLVQKGDRVVIATGIPITQRGRTNMIKVSVIE
ncbi:MAG: pyruvate kinase [Bacteroidetes bacterium]|nr:pyruvate kinase [Bacteroidota bacterium]MCH8523114.1 pyruvate kinase [Balneolales bacterium]